MDIYAQYLSMLQMFFHRENTKNTRQDHHAKAKAKAKAISATEKESVRDAA